MVQCGGCTSCGTAPLAEAEPAGSVDQGFWSGKHGWILLENLPVDLGLCSELAALLVNNF